jgi:hypothetical protein
MVWWTPSSPVTKLFLGTSSELDRNRRFAVAGAARLWNVALAMRARNVEAEAAADDIIVSGWIDFWLQER